MSASRNNHYVPRWHQSGFIEPEGRTLVYLDLNPRRCTLPDGRVVVNRPLRQSPPSRCFVERDLYSTFFGTSVNDEIERMLFGAIDAAGARAVRAFMGTDASEWHRHFVGLFTYLDIQRLRTPKGLDWLRSQYPELSQNELMEEMQGLRMIHCTIWTEGVREIVSAEDSAVKFILSDNPVTIFNPGLPPDAPGCVYPLDPPIALKGSQTLFPLNRDFCLILTNLEYAEDPAVEPLENRTFARNYRNPLARTDTFIRTRKLSETEVRHVNMAFKARARRYLAAGQPDWLYPESPSVPTWPEIAATLRPPKDAVWQFSGDLFAKFKDGQVLYQDAFGRREPEHQQMFKITPSAPKANEACGCGSGRRFRLCCEPIAKHLRPSWTQRSIRERNLALYRAAVRIFDLAPEKDWISVRRDMTDDKIRQIFEVFASLWPLETDLLHLLPKPDRRPRAIYSGLVHPEVITEVAAAAGLYFGEVIIQHPFMHPRSVREEYSPLDNPQAYRGEILKTLLCFLRLFPLVDAGIVNLIPDPCAFDAHLWRTMLAMAKERAADVDMSQYKADRSLRLVVDADRRLILNLPPDVLATQLRQMTPDLDDDGVAAALMALERVKLSDPLAVLQSDPLPAGEEGAQLVSMALVPNFEITMYLAQATGACIITDSKARFTELVWALVSRGVEPTAGLPDFARAIARASFTFPRDVQDIVRLAQSDLFAPYQKLFKQAARYLQTRERRGRKQNFESQLPAQLNRARGVQERLVKSGVAARQVQARALLPERGIRDNTVNRLLLMSSSEHHWGIVPMAVYLEPIAQSQVRPPTG